MSHPRSSKGPTSQRGEEMHDTQRERIELLRCETGVRSVEVLEITTVTASVQVRVRIRHTEQRSQTAVIAPSGRVHRL